jgi:glycyl-tRNA synthetase
MSTSKTIGQQVAGMDLMNKLTTLCKRRGFVFANSEVYTGLAGFWDYGPLGVELKRNIERFWWDFMVRRRDNVVGLDSSCIGPEAVWKASGHVDAFNDALVDDKNSKERFRIDQLLYANEDDAERAELFALQWIDRWTKHWSPKNPLTHHVLGEPIEEKLLPKMSVAAFEKDFWDGLQTHLGYYPKNPNTGKDSRFTIPRQFNLMFKQGIGATGEGAQVGYLRAETCQPIFVDFDNIRTSSRQKVPFGIAQIGKAFRNEINPRNFLFRAREFTQMELEFFVKPDALQERLGASTEAPAAISSTMDWYRYWLSQRQEYYKQLGIPDEMLRLHDHPPEKLAHYAKAACDIEFHFPFGWGELEGVHHRGQYDLGQHQQHSGKRFEYYDDEAEAQLIAGGMSKDEARALATYLPACIETSVGLDRTFLAVLTAAYYEDLQDTKHEGKDEDVRLVLRLHPRLAPVTCAIFPLSKKLSGPDSRAYKLYRELLDAGLAADRQALPPPGRDRHAVVHHLRLRERDRWRGDHPRPRQPSAGSRRAGRGRG